MLEGYQNKQQKARGRVKIIVWRSGKEWFELMIADNHKEHLEAECTNKCGAGKLTTTGQNQYRWTVDHAE